MFCAYYIFQFVILCWPGLIVSKKPRIQGGHVVNIRQGARCRRSRTFGQCLRGLVNKLLEEIRSPQIMSNVT